jgi:hypothetical protein
LPVGRRHSRCDCGKPRSASLHNEGVRQGSFPHCCAARRSTRPASAAIHGGSSAELKVKHFTLSAGISYLFEYIDISCDCYTLNTLITSSPRWLMPLTAMRPDAACRRARGVRVQTRPTPRRRSRPSRWFSAPCRGRSRRGSRRGGDGSVHFLLAGDALLPPVGVRLLRRVWPLGVRLARDLPFLPFESGMWVGLQPDCHCGVSG